MRVLIAIMATLSHLTMETTPETSAAGAECFLPFEENSSEQEGLETQELSKDILAVLDFCADKDFSYDDYLLIAATLVDVVIENFREEILVYMAENSSNDIDVSAIISESETIGKLRLVNETLCALCHNDEESEDEDEDEEDDDESELYYD